VTENGELQLSRKHAYYYQVQTQLYVCNKDFSDFVVWSQQDIHIERILPNREFWDSISTAASAFFQQALLPELVANYYSRTAAANTQDIEAATSSNSVHLDQTWCSCNGKEEGRMIACDNSDCLIEWFHYQCVGIKRKSKGKWYCPQCRK